MDLRDLGDFASAGATSGFFGLEFNFLAFFGGLEIVHHNRGIMEKVILAVFTVDEAKAFFLIEHFDSALHVYLAFPEFPYIERATWYNEFRWILYTFRVFFTYF